jgi:hypothetical protein
VKFASCASVEKERLVTAMTVASFLRARRTASRIVRFLPGKREGHYHITLSQ